MLYNSSNAVLLHRVVVSEAHEEVTMSSSAALRYVALRCVVLCYVALRCVALRCVAFALS